MSYWIFQQQTESYNLIKEVYTTPIASWSTESCQFSASCLTDASIPGSSRRPPWGKSKFLPPLHAWWQNTIGSSHERVGIGLWRSWGFVVFLLKGASSALEAASARVRSFPVKRSWPLTHVIYILHTVTVSISLIHMKWNAFCNPVHSACKLVHASTIRNDSKVVLKSLN